MFVQRRHGLNNRVIRVLKFRTMHVKEDGERVIQACRDDERVTRVGRLLRRTSLDELPQLFNVLRGDMSLVGPRPHALAHNVHYTKMLVRYANRHRVKPGITGWAQVNGCRGSTQMPAQMRRRVEHDLFYIDNWSFWLDLKIIILTPFRGMFSENAY
jgi:putative colanic acid biosynthesis UDP-glucose lipid carrier transferase